MKDLVEYIAKALVDHPDQVTVVEIQGQSAIVLELSVAESDMGRVIGRSGRVVNSIRTLIQAAAAKEGKRVTLEVV